MCKDVKKQVLEEIGIFFKDNLSGFLQSIKTMPEKERNDTMIKLLSVVIKEDTHAQGDAQRYTLAPIVWVNSEDNIATSESDIQQ